jgi:hypothetical protein
MKRGGEVYESNNLYLRLLVEDDTGQVLTVINRFKFDEMNGQHLAETSKENITWFLIKGQKRGEWQKLDIEHIINLGETLGDIR